MSCRLASPYRVSPATNSCATCRLNSILWERCLAMAFILRKPSSPCQFTNLNLSGPGGALHWNVRFVPVGDIKSLFDHFVGGGNQRLWYVDALLLRRLDIDDQLVL